jgi:hypothetical protein
MNKCDPNLSSEDVAAKRFVSTSVSIENSHRPGVVVSGLTSDSSNLSCGRAERRRTIRQDEFRWNLCVVESFGPVEIESIRPSRRIYLETKLTSAMLYRHLFDNPVSIKKIMWHSRTFFWIHRISFVSSRNVFFVPIGIRSLKEQVGILE